MPEMRSRSEKNMARRKQFSMSSDADAQIEGGSDDPLANDSGSSKENISYDGSS